MDFDIENSDLLDAVPDAIVIVDQQGLIVAVNLQTESLFGYEKSALVGQTIELLLPERYKAGHPHKRTSFFDSPRLRPMGRELELYARRQNGSEFPVEISLSPVSTSLVASAIRDVSYRKDVERQLQEAKNSAESATQMKSRFLAAASHDLRQPLQSLGLYLSVLQKKVVELPEAVEIGDKMRNSLNVMGELMDVLLDISKLDSGAVEPDLKEFGLQSLFDQLSSQHTPQAREKHLAFVVESTQQSVISDPGLLQRVLENLVTNAIRYTEQGVVTMRCVLLGDRARIDVIDTGVGIPSDAQETIFDEYFQLDNPVRDRRKGLGLGLSIVKHIAKILDHRIELESEVGQGSRFSVFVPLGQKTETDPEGGAQVVTVSTTSGQRSVLVIDDDAAIVDATKMLLELLGYVVQIAQDGVQALELIDAGVRPDFVVTDYRLPGVNGLEVLRQIRAKLEVVLPAVLVTGDTATTEIDERHLDRIRLLHKPIDTDELIRVLEQALGTGVR